jgi:hypothetical protein
MGVRLEAKNKRVLVDVKDELAKLRKRRDKLEREIARYAKTVVLLESGRETGMKRGAVQSATGLADNIEQVMLMNGDRPMTIREITAQLENLDVATQSKRFSGTVYATAQLSPRFCKLEDARWCRVSVAPPAQVKMWQAVQQALRQQRYAAKEARLAKRKKKKQKDPEAETLAWARTVAAGRGNGHNAGG